METKTKAEVKAEIFSTFKMAVGSGIIGVICLFIPSIVGTILAEMGYRFSGIYVFYLFGGILTLASPILFVVTLDSIRLYFKAKNDVETIEVDDA